MAEEFIDSVRRQIWKEEKGMQVSSFCHPARHTNFIDVFVDEPIDFFMAEKRKVVMEPKQISILVVSIKDLIRLKQIAGRPQDLADIDALYELENIR